MLTIYSKVLRDWNVNEPLSTVGFFIFSFFNYFVVELLQFSGNTVLVMRPYFRAGSGSILLRENRVSAETEFSWGGKFNSVE